MSTSETSSDAFTPYQRRLFIFLSVATFFEGFDFLALAQILPNLRADMGLSEGQGGLLFGFVNAGTVMAFLLVRRADSWGRRRVLTLTIAGYTTFTFLSGLAPNVWVFGILQFVARVFLIGEWATSMVIAAEEFPARRRGMAIGVIQAFASLGSIVCAGVVPPLLETEYGWRSVYFVGIVPLVILAYARRNLKETRRFTEQVGEAAVKKRRGLFHILGTPYRKRLLQVALIWLLSYICAHTGVSFWKEFAIHERGFTDAEVGMAIVIAAPAAMPMVFYAGKLLDVLGRRVGGALIFLVGGVGIVLCYQLHGFWPLTVALTFGIFGASAMAPVLNAYTAELFPTELRADAFALANNLLGRIGYVAAPVAVGFAAEIYGWGPSVSATFVFQVAAIVLILWLLPETRAKELEETASLDGASAESK